MLTADEVTALADLPIREVLLAQLAGALQAPLAQFAGLLAALPRNFAYGLKALIDQQGGVPADRGSTPRRSPRPPWPRHRPPTAEPDPRPSRDPRRDRSRR